MREEKKYQILPGVEIPDMKKIQEAASDFSVSEVGDVDIKTTVIKPISGPAAPGVSAEELERLKALGVTVAESEDRAKAESRAKMDKIMNKAVQAPESIGDLKASHIAHMNEEKRKQMEENMKEAQKQQAEEEAKMKAREERRQLQQHMLEEAKERAAKEKAEREAAEKEAAENEDEKIKREAEEMASRLAAPVVENAPVAEAPAEVSAAPAAKETTGVFFTKPAAETAPAAPVVQPAAKPVEAKAEETPAPVKAEEVKAEEKKPEEKKPEEPVEEKRAKIMSSEESLADFMAFLDEDQ